VTGPAAMPAWQDVELGAPEIAWQGMARLNAARLALLGTLRRDGSLRISPIEPVIAGTSCSSVPWPNRRRQATCCEIRGTCCTAR
jgi:hypothetical protein